MKRFIKPASLLLCLAFLQPSRLAPFAAAQVTTLPAIKVKQPKPKIDKFRGESMNFTPVAITVRDPKNTTSVRTFHFTSDLERKMEGRFVENGDKVTVHFVKGSDTAVKISAKIHSQGSPMVKR